MRRILRQLEIFLDDALWAGELCRHEGQRRVMKGTLGVLSLGVEIAFSLEKMNMVELLSWRKSRAVETRIT